jgi:carbonic anhydrase
LAGKTPFMHESPGKTMTPIEMLLRQNKSWAQEKKAVDPQYFTRLAKIQKPHSLWIGCSDSRIPADTITATEPGEIFIHRNIANLVVSTDFNLLSVLEYAVDILKVRQILICGHEQCGGIQAALSPPPESNFVYVGKWLKYIRDTHRLYQDEIDALPDEQARANKLAELSVKEQVKNLAETFIVRRAWERGQELPIYGLMYSLKEGTLRIVTEKTGLMDD